MSVLNQSITMNTGSPIPVLGLGTWQIPNDAVEAPVLAALKNGYRHIDSAAGYQNEVGVGNAIRNSGIPRSEIFVTTKIRAELKTYEQAKQEIADSLAKLDIDYIDLMIIHAPRPWPEMGSTDGERYFEHNAQVYKALEEAHAAGTIKAIGVSNFMKDDLEELLKRVQVVPAINQIRFHIGCLQADTVALCKEKGIVVEAYSPLATGRLLEDENLQKLADKYGVSTAQLAIQFTLQHGTVSLPKSTNEGRIIENATLDFVISDEDMAHLNQIEV